MSPSGYDYWVYCLACCLFATDGHIASQKHASKLAGRVLALPCEAAAAAATDCGAAPSDAAPPPPPPPVP
eukprot:6348966-Lingulodinium_polyedra.AAC.1